MLLHRKHLYQDCSDSSRAQVEHTVHIPHNSSPAVQIWTANMVEETGIWEQVMEEAAQDQETVNHLLYMNHSCYPCMLPGIPSSNSQAVQAGLVWPCNLAWECLKLSFRVPCRGIHARGRMAHQHERVTWSFHMGSTHHYQRQVSLVTSCTPPLPPQWPVLLKDEWINELLTSEWV